MTLWHYLTLATLRNLQSEGCYIADSHYVLVAGLALLDLPGAGTEISCTDTSSPCRSLYVRSRRGKSFCISRICYVCKTFWLTLVLAFHKNEHECELTRIFCSPLMHREHRGFKFVRFVRFSNLWSECGVAMQSCSKINVLCGDNLPTLVPWIPRAFKSHSWRIQGANSVDLNW